MIERHQGPAMIVTDEMVRGFCYTALVGVVCDDNNLIPFFHALTYVERAIAARTMCAPTRAHYQLRNDFLEARWDAEIVRRAERLARGDYVDMKPSRDVVADIDPFDDIAIEAGAAL